MSKFLHHHNDNDADTDDARAMTIAPHFLRPELRQYLVVFFENSRAKNVIKNNFRILKKQYAHLQTILKAPVKFEKGWPKTVKGVAGTRRWEC